MNYVKQLSLYNFRNYKHVQVEFEPVPIVLYGPNGSGKTNLMEALSLFSLGTGFRKAKLQELCYRNEEEITLSWAANAVLNQDMTMSTGISAESGKIRRLCKIQGEFVKSAACFHDYIRIIPITPDMDHLFTAPSIERRHFIDYLITSYNSSHALCLSAYEKATKQRLSLLKKSLIPDPLWLDSLEKIMASHNIKITQARIDFTNCLLQGVQNHIPLFPQFSCRMIGKIEDILQSNTINSETEIQETLKKNRDIDRTVGITTLGCHRSDFEVIHKNHQRLVRNCSTGEQKIILISVILSFVHQNVKNSNNFLILLLDDVIARLDLSHRMVLFDQVDHLSLVTKNKSSVQTFFSGTDRELFIPMRKAQFLEVNKAKIIQ